SEKYIKDHVADGNGQKGAEGNQCCCDDKIELLHRNLIARKIKKSAAGKLAGQPDSQFQISPLDGKNPLFSTRHEDNAVDANAEQPEQQDKHKPRPEYPNHAEQGDNAVEAHFVLQCPQRSVYGTYGIIPEHARQIVLQGEYQQAAQIAPGFGAGEITVQGK